MLELRHLSKTYEGQPLLDDVSFTVAEGETVCLLGASGSGKSTLLRMIAGLESPERGTISFDGLDLAQTPSHLRDFGLVFQDYALFPHLTVFDNAAFGLKMRNQSKDEIQARVSEVLNLVNLTGFAHRRVTELSGGEQQRVAVARALAIRPRLLMFDEPLSSLDRALKDEVLDELRHILHETRIPAVYVTHDQEEAFTIADRILLLHEGRILREGTPAEVWSHPGSAWVARFLNVGNVVEGRVKSRMSKVGRWQVETSLGQVSVACGHAHADGERVALLLKPSDAGPLTVTAKVEDVVFQREQFKVELAGGLFIHLKDAPQVGESISVTFDVECLSHE
ncbi:MAG: ABC transporter ATP-binding protein [Chloroflexi bacterium]|nr:ABC transporter ATP-binding protein [Chloroflexota bacterium]